MSLELCGFLEDSHSQQHAVIGLLDPVGNRNAVVVYHGAFLFPLRKPLAESLVDVAFVREDLDHLIQSVFIGAALFEEEHLILIEKTAHNILVVVQHRNIDLIPVSGFLQFLLEFLLIEDLADPDDRLGGLEGQFNR